MELIIVTNHGKQQRGFNSFQVSSSVFNGPFNGTRHLPSQRISCSADINLCLHEKQQAKNLFRSFCIKRMVANALEVSCTQRLRQFRRKYFWPMNSLFCTTCRFSPGNNSGSHILTSLKGIQHSPFHHFCLLRSDQCPS